MPFTSANHAEQPNGPASEASDGVPDASDAAQRPDDARRPSDAKQPTNGSAATSLSQEENEAQG